MQLIIDYILKNKEWIFSGIGVFVLTGLIWFLRRLFFSNSPHIDGESGSQLRREFAITPLSPHQSTTSRGQGGGSNGVTNVVPDNWQGIVPPQSRYEFVTETTDSIPLGLQSFSFEYGPQGHAKALTLKGAIVRAEIQFTCRISNPYKAVFSANEYALNVLQPRFLSQARGILERFSLPRLRAGRQEAAREIMAQLSSQFEELGVHLELVTIGALDQIERGKA
ncbi:MAG: SPFH domain-containing protein [Pyrinomonadaceae bacterium]